MCFNTSRKLSEFIGKARKQRLDYFDLYTSKLNDSPMHLYVSHKRARKSSHIHCTESVDIVWERFYPFGGMSRPAREQKYVLKPVCDKNAITVVIIRGTPGNITGLDNGIFKSHLNTPEKNNVYLMAEKNMIFFVKRYQGV